MIVHWEGRISLRETFSTKRYYGRSLGLYRDKHPDEARRLSPWRSSFLRNWTLLARQPHLTGGLVLLKSVELIGINAGMRSGRGTS